MLPQRAAHSQERERTTARFDGGDAPKTPKYRTTAVRDAGRAWAGDGIR